MSHNDWIEQGSFIPFPVPIQDFPDTDIEAEPQVRLCFNAAWLPFVMGALKVLARPETWEATAATTDVLVEQAMRLQALSSDGCAVTPVEPLNWYLEAVVLNGTFDGDLFDDVVRVLIGSTPADHYRIAITGIGGVAPEFNLVGRRRSDDALVGGQFETTDFSDQTGTGHAVTTTVMPCVGSNVVDTNFTPFSIGPGEYKEIDVVCGNASITYFVDIFISGDWTCGPA